MLIDSMLCYIILCYVVSCHVTSRHAMSCYMFWRFIYDPCFLLKVLYIVWFICAFLYFTNNPSVRPQTAVYLI